MLLKIHPDNPEERKIRQVVECLLDGGVIIYPTDTVYAIGCIANKNRSVEKVAKLKGLRTKDANFSLVCYDLSNIAEFAKVDTSTYKLMKKALPGPFTFILPATNNVPKIFKNNKKEIGIRVPDNNIARLLSEKCGFPLISTSVYDDDEILEYATDPELIYEKYQRDVDIVINGGYGNIDPSTIINCINGEPEIIREGIGNIQQYL